MGRVALGSASTRSSPIRRARPADAGGVREGSGEVDQVGGLMARLGMRWSLTMPALQRHALADVPRMSSRFTRPAAEQLDRADGEGDEVPPGRATGRHAYATTARAASDAGSRSPTKPMNGAMPGTSTAQRPKPSRASSSPTARLERHWQLDRAFRDNAPSHGDWRSSAANGARSSTPMPERQASRGETGSWHRMQPIDHWKFPQRATDVADLDGLVDRVGSEAQEGR